MNYIIVKSLALVLIVSLSHSIIGQEDFISRPTFGLRTNGDNPGYFRMMMRLDLDDDESLPSIFNAIRQGSLAELKAALKNGEKPNKVNFEGDSPLIAIFTSAPVFAGLQEQMTKILIDSGANPDLKMTSGLHAGKSAGDLAREAKDPRALKAFNQYRNPSSLSSLATASLAKAIKEGRVTIEDIKKYYPEEGMPKDFYKQLETLSK